MEIKREIEKNKNNKLLWRIILLVILSLIIVLSTNGIFWALGFFEESIIRIIIAIVLSLVFVFSMVAISWAVSFRRNNKE